MKGCCCWPEWRFVPGRQILSLLSVLSPGRSYVSFSFLLDLLFTNNCAIVSLLPVLPIITILSQKSLIATNKFISPAKIQGNIPDIMTVKFAQSGCGNVLGDRKSESTVR